MKFSVLIPTYNRRDVLARTLAAVFEQDFPAHEFEVIVVVDGSTDGTLEMLQGLRPRCGFRYFYQPNRGLPKARNLGLKAAAGELVLLLDDDIVCVPSLLRMHLEAHAGANKRVVFGPVLLHPDSPPGLIADQWTVSWKGFQERLERENGCGPPTKLWLAAKAPAVNRSMPRPLLESIGGCDEAMKDCHEDWELGIRLWKAGAEFHFQPEAVAYHFYVKSDRVVVRQDSPMFARGEVALSRKHPEYRPLSALATIASGRLRHRLFVAAAVRLPFSLDPVLRPMFLMLDALRTHPRLHRGGMHLLGYRSGLRTFREAARFTGSRRALKAEFGVQLPVLAYHHVGRPKPGTYPDLSVTPKHFERHMQWLAGRGYRTIRPADWLRWRRDGTGLPRKPVLLTFDDAFADLAEHAFPVLRRYGFTATVFVVTGHIGGVNSWDQERGSAIHPLMTADQLRYWADQGMDFGAHSRTHPDLTVLAPEAAKQEVTGSRDELAAILGRPVTAFAYPYGRENEAVCESVRNAFEIAFTTGEGLNTLDTDVFRLRRSCVGLHDSIAGLECLLRWGMRPLPRLRSKLRLRQRAKEFRIRLGIANRNKQERDTVALLDSCLTRRVSQSDKIPGQPPESL